VLATGLFPAPLRAADDDEKRALHITAQAFDSPPRVVLSWTGKFIPSAPSRLLESVGIYRREVGTRDYTFVGSVTDPAQLSFTDTTITPGTLYEYLGLQYELENVSWYFPVPYSYNGRTASGVDVPLNDSPGTLLLLVDETVAPAISGALEVYRRNLIGAGWKPIVVQVARDTNSPGTFGPPALTSDPRPTKQIITNTLTANPDLKGVVLIGHVTMPFTGNESPDLHGQRAMASDAYYADINEVWQDTVAHTPDLQPHNSPGDLRWDTKVLEGRELMVGRIDMAALPAFAESETNLLSRYFRKNHLHRHAYVEAERKALYTSSYPLMAPTLQNMTSYLGYDSLLDGKSADWGTLTAGTSYLFAAAGTHGGYDNTLGIRTSNMAQNDYNVTFATAGASYMMETWRPNSALRGLIAGPAYGIGSIVSHGYYGDISFPTFSMGRPLGEVMVGQVADYRFFWFPPERGEVFDDRFGSVLHNLQGDPAVTLYATKAPGNLLASASGAHAILNWTASAADNLVGYHVYRSSGWDAPFARLTTNPVTALTFTDTTARTGAVLYMVRAVNLETRGTGTYFAASQGIFAPLSLDGTSNTPPTANPQTVSVNEDTPAPVILTGNDSDPLEFFVVTRPAHGRLDGDGANLVYTPDPDFFGTDSFTIIANDGYLDSAPATITMNVGSVNDAPVWSETPRAVTAFRHPATPSDFPLATDVSDIDSDPLTFRIVTPPTKGTASISGSTLLYRPNDTATGTDTLAIVANDGTVDTAPKTVTITIATDLALTSNLRAWWKFNESSGTSAADSAGTFPATLTAGTTFAPSGGIFGGALRTAGANQAAGVATQVFGTSRVGTGAISVWFKPADKDNNTRNQIVAEMGNGNGSTGLTLFIRNGSLFVHAQTDGNVSTSDTLSATAITNDAWHHLVLSFDMVDNVRYPEVLSAYLNGALIGRLPGMSFFKLSQPHGMGNRSGNAYIPGNRIAVSADAWFDGWVDDVRAYSVPLRAPQVVALAAEGGITPPATNELPNAVATVSPTSGYAPLTVTWNGSGSSDPDGTIASHAWSFSEGGTATGTSVQRTYPTAGSYSATLTVTDNLGATRSTTVNLNVLVGTTTRGTSIPWLISQFGTAPDYDVLDLLDHDGDGSAAWLEFRAGTDPKSAIDAFRITSIEPHSNGTITLHWRGSSAHGVNTPFRVMGSPTLAPDSWQPRSGDLPRAADGNNTFTDTPPADTDFFYLIEIP
jgi:PKD repeat protein